MRPVYLLDTNVISEFSKPEPNMNLISRVSSVQELCVICSVVWQEICYGYTHMPEGKRKSRIATFMNRVRSEYEIIPYDSFASQICGEIRARCAEKGEIVPYCDSQIAATAIANNMILITHNTADFEPLVQNSMLRVEDWWVE